MDGPVPSCACRTRADSQLLLMNLALPDEPIAGETGIGKISGLS